MIDNRQLLVEAQHVVDEWMEARKTDYQSMYEKLIPIIEQAIKSAYEHGYKDGLVQAESEGEQ